MLSFYVITSQKNNQTYYGRSINNDNLYLSLEPRFTTFSLYVTLNAILCSAIQTSTLRHGINIRILLDTVQLKVTTNSTTNNYDLTAKLNLTVGTTLTHDNKAF